MTLVWCSGARPACASDDEIHALLTRHASRAGPMRIVCARNERMLAPLRTWCTTRVVNVRRVDHGTHGSGVGAGVVAHALACQASVIVAFAASEHESRAVHAAVESAKDVGVLRSVRTIIIVHPGEAIGDGAAHA